MSFFRERQIDFDAHNAMVKELYENFRAGHPSRIPVQIEGSIRNYFSNEEINRSHWSFADFFTDARAHIECQLEYQYYQRFHLYCDREMGLPDQWRLSMDFQNSYDQAWFGCPIQYFGKGDVPDTREILRENPRELYSWEDPDPFWGRGDFMKRAWEMFEEIQKRCDAGLEFHRRQVVAPDLFPHVMTDGVFDCAVKLRGAVELMIDMYANPGYFHDLMKYITDNLIRRMKAHRKFHHERIHSREPFSPRWPDFFYADDSIAMLSQGQFQEFVLPYMERIFDEFHDGNGCMIHLCGDATHHFKFLKEHFHVKYFDTGFPVDHGALRRELGREVILRGGPTVMLVQRGTPDEIEQATKAICRSGALDGGKFILIAANNLAPCTPLENTDALYAAGKKYGRL